MQFKNILLLFLFSKVITVFAQNSMVGDGFGGRLWYKPYNYSVGSYSGYTVCGDSFQLYGWGINQYGQLGNGNIITSRTPVKALGMTNVKFYSCGYIMSVIKCDSTGWVWGRGSPAQYTPISVVNKTRFTDAGSHAVSFVKYDGTVWSVGLNNHGEFGNGSISTFYTNSPQQMTGIDSAVRVAIGFYTITVLLSNGTVVSCGRNIYGGLGNNSPITSVAYTPVKVAGLRGIVDIKAVDYTIIALDSSGNVYQWGKNVASLNYDSVPVKISQLKNIVAISGCDDGAHFLALDSNKNCYGWGIEKMFFGAGSSNLGIDTPMKVETDVVDILAGEYFSYIVKSDSSFWASGANLPIWMNLSDSIRGTFTKLEPTAPPMNLCGAMPFHKPYTIYDSVNVCTGDSVFIRNKYYKPNITLRDSIKGGPCSVDSLRITVITDKFIFHKSFTICQGENIKVGVHTYSQTGIYIDSLLSHRGCDSIIITSLTVNNRTFFLQGSTICNGDSVRFVNKYYKNQGTYHDTLINSIGCDSILTLNLTVNSASYFSQNINRCPGDSLVINNKSYYQTGTYTDTLKNINACDSILITNLTVFNSAVTNKSFSICEYENIHIGNNNYTKAGNYTDSLKTRNGCDSIVNTTIIVKKTPLLNIRDTSLCENHNEVVHLNAGNYKTFLWLPGGEISNDFYVSKPGIYSVFVTNFDSCTATDTFMVKDICPPVIIIPNVFTINNDNLNDAFDIEIKGESEYHLQIFNRWGELVFESNQDGIDNDGINWNGLKFNKGSECPDGVYYFLFNYQFPGGKPGSHKGDVTLIRK